MGYECITTPGFAQAIDKSLPSIFFDLDHTIIFPTRKKRFYSKTDPSDYIFNQYVIEVLSKAIGHYTIYFVTNQIKYDEIVKSRIALVLKDLRSHSGDLHASGPLHVCVLISTDRDYYRKPAPGLVLEPKIPGGLPSIDLHKSFHCGDAGGRGATATAPADFSDDDLWFANHVGIHYFTPEEVFNESFKYSRVTPYKPPKIIVDVDLVKKLKDICLNYEGVILVGLPGSGKSYIRKWIIENINPKVKVIVWNKDEKIPKGKVVYDPSLRYFHIFDNTNLKEKERVVDFKCATVYIDIDRKEAIRGIKYRSLMEGGLYVPDVVINTMDKYKEPPYKPEVHLNKRPVLSKDFPPYLL